MIFTLTSKKILISSFILASTTSIAFAAQYKDAVAPCPTPPTLSDGFYVGLQGGYDSYKVKLKDTIDTSTSTNTLSPTGWVGGIFAGYGRYFDQFYLGGEVFVNDSSASDSRSFNESVGGVAGSGKVSANGSYGLALLPGYKFTASTLGYIRLGYNWANLKVSESLTGTTTEDENISGSNTSSGFVYGVGVETLVPQLSDHFSVRAEYTYVDYSSIREDNGDVRFSPSDNQFMLSLIYHI